MKKEKYPQYRISEAITNGCSDDLEALVIEFPKYFRPRELCFAAALGHVNVMDVLVRHGLNVNILDGQERPLHRAASEGHVEAVRWLLEHGADPDGVWTETYPTPLDFAASNHLGVVKVLVEHGANVNAYFRDSSGVLRNPLFSANLAGRGDITEYLKQHGAMLPVDLAPKKEINGHDLRTMIVDYLAKSIGRPMDKALVEIIPSGIPIDIHVIPPKKKKTLPDAVYNRYERGTLRRRRGQGWSGKNGIVNGITAGLALGHGVHEKTAA